MKKRKLLIRWLQDAYAMEKEVIKTFQNHKKDFKNVALIQRQLEEHIQDSKEQAEKVRVCLRELGEDIPTLHTISISRSVPHEYAEGVTQEEKLLGNCITEYVTEHSEIAMYRKIMAAAEECNMPAIAEMCQQIIGQEEEMSELAIENLDRIISGYIAEKTGG